MEKREPDNLIFYSALLAGAILVYPILKMFLVGHYDIELPSLGKAFESSIIMFFSWVFLLFIGFVCRKRDSQKLKKLGFVYQILGVSWLVILIWMFSGGARHF